MTYFILHALSAMTMDCYLEMKETLEITISLLQKNLQIFI